MKEVAHDLRFARHERGVEQFMAFVHDAVGKATFAQEVAAVEGPYEDGIRVQAQVAVGQPEPPEFRLDDLLRQAARQGREPGRIQLRVALDNQLVGYDLHRKACEVFTEQRDIGLRHR